MRARPLFSAFSRLTALCFALLISLSLNGCSHYRLGTDHKLTFSTLYVAPIENEAVLPQITALFSSELRTTFLRDARVTLVNSPTGADATLTVSVARYSRVGATGRLDDGGLARKFNFTITAVCTLTDNRTRKPLFEKRVIEVTRQFFSTPTPTSRESDQLQAEYNLMPILANALADRVTHATLDVW